MTRVNAAVSWGSAREEAIEYLALSRLTMTGFGRRDRPQRRCGTRLSYLQGGTKWEREVVKSYAKGLYDLQDNKKWQRGYRRLPIPLKSDA